MMNTNNETNPNGVNERTRHASQLSPGSGTVGNQAVRGRHLTTETSSRRKYTREDNRAVMRCYYRSRPDEMGYRKRMHEMWKDQGGFEISEQRMADQVRTIKRKQWFTSEELDEIKECEKPSQGVEITVMEDLGELPTEREDIVNRADSEILTAVTEPQSEDEISLIRSIVEKRDSLRDNRPRLTALRHIERAKIMTEVNRIDKVLPHVQTNDITEVNDTIMACAILITDKLCPVTNGRDGQQRSKTPAWKERLQRKVKAIQKDLSRVILSRGRPCDDGMRKRLEKKYNIKRKGFDVVIEELKQDLSAVSQKIKRFSERTKQYNENRMFMNNQRQFYQNLQRKNSNEAHTAPDKQETRVFWQGIWGKKTTHNNNASWIGRVKQKLESVRRQEDLDISVEDVKSMLSKVPNWKAAGPDGVQGFWLKNFKSLYARIGTLLQACLDTGETPKWMTTGRTALIMKDPTRGNEPGNYRPITCLPLMWKTLTGIVANKLYEHLEDQDMIGNEQMGCRRNTRGTKDHLMLDKTVLRDSKTRKTNLAMGWIDYRKAYDLVPHSWIIETMKITGMASNAVQLISQSMGSWNTRLEYLGEHLTDVDIKRGIFQGDSLSPLLFITSLIPMSLILRDAVQGYGFREGRKVNHLLFMDDLKLYGKKKTDLEALMNTVRIFSEDIRMEFGLSKCATVIMKRGKKVEDAGISMPDGQVIEDLGNEAYKYLGVLEANKIKMEEMKQKVQKDYYGRIRKVLESSLNGGNSVMAMNTWAVAAVRYTAGILDWTVNELKGMDRKTRKLMTMNRALHPKADVDRLYLPREEGGRGMMSIEEVVRSEECSLSDYLKRTMRNEDGVMDMFVKENSQKDLRIEQKKKKMENWMGKALHGQYPTKTDEMNISSWRWLKTGYMKKETEGFLMAAQDQALPTRNYKVTIMKQVGTKKCRMCGERDETVMHILSECSKLAQTEYKKRHDKVATLIHWELCKKYGFNHSKKWYDHRAEAVLEHHDIKILWDFNIRTDKVIEARRPDIVVVDKRKNETVIIDVAVPGDFRVKESEMNKITKYQDLAMEINKMWKTKAKVIPIVMGVLGAKHLLTEWLALLGVQGKRVDNIQQTALLGSAHILRKVLSIPV